MMRKFKYTLLLLCTVLLGCCSDNGKRPTDNDETRNQSSQQLPVDSPVHVETNQPQVSLDDDFHKNYLDGDLNHDGIKDSVFYEVPDGNGDTRTITKIYWGKGNGEYTLFKAFTLNESNLFPNVHGDTLSFWENGISYHFQYDKDNFYWIGFDFLDLCCPQYSLDYINKEMTFFFDEMNLANYDLHMDGFYRTSTIDLPLDSVPSSYTIDKCFEMDFDHLGKFTDFDTSFLYPKVDSFMRIFIRELPKQRVEEEEQM